MTGQRSHGRTRVAARASPSDTPVGSPAAWEWGLLAILCAGCLLFWWPQYDRFALPPRDFNSFALVGEALWSGQLPASFKRMPLFPFLIGWAGRVFPGAGEPMLHAALVWNQAASIGILVGTFLLSRRLVGSLALIPVILLASTRVFHAMALSALVEPTLTFLIVLTLVLFASRSSWQYAAAGLAALARYEAAALPLILFALNWQREGRFFRHLRPAMLAALGVGVWMALGAAASLPEGGFANPYLEFTAKAAAQGGTRVQPVIAWTLLRSTYAGVEHIIDVDLRLLDAWALVLVGVGILGLHRRDRQATAAILLFGACYLVLHLYMNVDRARYAHPVAWIPPLLASAGVAWVLSAASGRLGPRRSESLAPGLAAVATLVVALMLWRYAIPRRLLSIATDVDAWVYAAYLGLLLGVGFACALFSLRASRRAALLVAVGLAGPLILVGTTGMRGTANDVQKLRYGGYVHVRVRNWLEENLVPGEKALVVERSYALRTSHLSEDQLIEFSMLDARTHGELAAELARRDVDYVVYTFWKSPPRDPDARNYNRELLYYNRRKLYLSEPFQAGSDLPHFDHVATLPVPDFLNSADAHVYRFVPEAATTP